MTKRRQKQKEKEKGKKEKSRGRELTIFKAEIAEKYGAPVYSRQPPITAIFPETQIAASGFITQNYIYIQKPCLTGYPE